MVKEKVVRGKEGVVEYSQEHWNIFNILREKAFKIVNVFIKGNIETLTYGSIARGDITPKSDIDIILLQLVPSYRVELILEENSFYPISRKLVQATPNDVIKINYELEDNISISVLMTPYTRRAFEFYRFGGAVNFEELQENLRVSGVNKQLKLILPNPKGHSEYSLLDMKYKAAKTMGISQEIVEQRIRVLTRRDKVGRTGVFLDRSLHPSENPEQVLRELSNSNPLIRRRTNL